MSSQLSAHSGAVRVAQHPHPNTQQSQLQPAGGASVLQLPDVLSPTFALWQCTQEESFAEARLLPGFPAPVPVQQKQRHLTAVHVYVLRHQLHPGQVRRSLRSFC